MYPCQKLLLITDYHARPANPHPGNQRLRVAELSVLTHDVAANKSASTSKSRPTVHRYCFALADLRLHYIHKTIDNVIRWTASIRKFQVIYLDSFLLENLLFIQPVI